MPNRCDVSSKVEIICNDTKLTLKLNHVDDFTFYTNAFELCSGSVVVKFPGYGRRRSSYMQRRSGSVVVVLTDCIFPNEFSFGEEMHQFLITILFEFLVKTISDASFP